ncbi:MFS general substrate transporter [Pholiota conissans]|uniref:MFS general substrate transporter n=1 Tax=Pholiota conissans TaxID=109636 RepID=A0A9P5Z5M2_9AGAR|nr:MFS general substrate transporter [Pholiota conissans]
MVAKYHSSTSKKYCMPQDDTNAETATSLEDLAEIISSSMSRRTTRFDVPSISPLADVRMPDYASTVIVPRQQSSSALQPCSDYSPYSSYPSTAVNSRAPSPTKELEDYEDFNPGPDRLKWRLASGFFALFVGGWADGVTGTVMPYLSEQFHMNSTLSSSLFAGTTCGVFTATLLVESIMGCLGTFRVHRNERSFFACVPTLRKKTAFDNDFGFSVVQARFLILVIASILHSTYFVMMASQSSFPVMFVAYIMSAFSRMLLSAPLNAYFTEGPKQALGYGLGLASMGSVISPLVCQSIIATGVPWYRFYYGSLVLSGLNVFFLAITFNPTASETFRDRQKALHEGRKRKGEFLRSGCSSPVCCSNDQSTVKLDLASNAQSALRMALKLPYQWAFSFFILLYCGSETTTQGFMVTYLLSVRHADAKTIGYVTSGFWGGISMGRFFWGSATPLLTFTQRKYVVHSCMCVAIALHLTTWLVKSTIENAVAASLIGLLYGPIFPGCLSMATEVLPVEVHMVAMALISSFGSLGGAIFPLVAGTILDAKGDQTLTYLTVALAAAMACLWTLFPSRIPSRPMLD